MRLRTSQPTRPRRSPEGKPATGGRGRYRSTERGPVTVCRHNLGGRPGRVPGRAANLTLASARRSRTAGVRYGCARARPRRRRSGRVSGIRPSDRRGPGPVGHRGRNVRSTGRCSYNLRITRRRADSCGLHRSTSQVIRRSGSGVYMIFVFFSYLFFSVSGDSGPSARTARGSPGGCHLSVDAWSGSRRADRRRGDGARPRGRIWVRAEPGS